MPELLERHAGRPASMSLLAQWGRVVHNVDLVHKEDFVATRSRGVRVSEELDRQIAREAAAEGKSWSATTAELLEEAIRMRRAPGVIFMSGPAGRRAVIAGTGLDIWEVVATWRDVEQSFEALRQSYPWLTESQLRAALAYYQLYPDEIDERLRREEEWTPERVRRELPFADPSLRRS